MEAEKPLDVVAMRALLGRLEPTLAWLTAMDTLELPSGRGKPEIEVTLPAAYELPPLLIRLAVAHEDVDDVLALLPSPEKSPGIWWLLERCVRALVPTIGAVEGPPAFPKLPEELGTSGRYF